MLDLETASWPIRVWKQASVLKPTGGRTPWSMPGGPGRAVKLRNFAGVLKGAANS
jgi:hypothetical protein